MEYILPDNDAFIPLWTKFVKENSNATWAYLPKRLEFYHHYSKEYRIKDLSFIIIQDNQSLCICPLFLEQPEGNRYFSYAGGYLRAPIFNETLHEKYREKVQKKCFKKIDELANENKVDKVMFMLDALSSRNSYNILMKYGYLDSSINSSILDLRKNKEDIWSNLRNSYKSLINNGKDKFEVVIIDYKNPDKKIFNLHRKLHFKTAGRITRPEETWELQYKMLQDDNAILIGLRDERQFVGFSYLVHHNGKAYYGNSSNDPEYSGDIPLEHTIIWSAIEYYRERNFDLLEIGQQQFGDQVFDHPSKKDLDISFFKRGFGGKVVTLYRGVKYCNKELMKKDLNRNITEMLKSISI